MRVRSLIVLPGLQGRPVSCVVGSATEANLKLDQSLSAREPTLDQSQIAQPCRAAREMPSRISASRSQQRVPRWSSIASVSRKLKSDIGTSSEGLSHRYLTSYSYAADVLIHHLTGGSAPVPTFDQDVKW